MPPHPQDTDSSRPARPRSNTNSFPFSAWRRNRSDQLQTAPLPPSPSPAIQVLIDDLTPPAVPSLQYARSLASALAAHSPLPRPSILSPILASLCAVDSPPSLQVAGYDILSAYWENSEATALSTSDRLVFFSLFLGPTSTWTIDSWEPRFKALRAFTRFGTEIVGIELPFLNVLKGWINSAFEALGSDSIERAERAERERCIDILASFLTSVTGSQDVVARIPEEELAGVLQFYASLVDYGMRFPSHHPQSPTSSPVIETIPSPRVHRRHQSSVSVSSLASPNIASHSPSFITKHPADIAVNLYLNHLSSQLKIISPSHLNDILPLLFRAAAFYATPLPRITVMSTSSSTSKPATNEERITECLSALYSGPYSSSCFLALKRSLSPVMAKSDDANSSIQRSLGAVRTLRVQIRKSLSTRLARAYISRDVATSYTVSGAPAQMEVVERELIERAWAKDDLGGWDAGRLGTVLAQGVEAWIKFELPPGLNGEEPSEEAMDGFRSGREKILDEAAGTLKDVFQELDARDEEDAALDEEEASAVGATLSKLASYVTLLRNPNGSMFALPLSQPSDAPSPFIRTLASLLARDHATTLCPPLSAILLSVASNLTDEDTAKLPVLMTQEHDLSPTSPDWLSNWDSLLGESTLLIGRPATREAVLTALQLVHDPVKDMPRYRRPLADLVLAFARREHVREEDSAVAVAQGDTDDAVWLILGDEVVARQVEDQEGDGAAITEYLEFIEQVAHSRAYDEPVDEEEDDTVSVAASADISSPSSHPSTSTIVSPLLSRIQSDQIPGKVEKEPSNLPSVMSLLTSITTGGNTALSQSRSESMQPQSVTIGSPAPNSDQIVQAKCKPKYKCSSVGATSALISIFHQLALTPLCRSERNLQMALSVFDKLLAILKHESQASARSRLAVLQFIMRLRADRDHHLYYVESQYDRDGLIAMLASLVGRTEQQPGEGLSPTPGTGSERLGEDFGGDPRKARPRVPAPERYGRRLSRGRGAVGLSNNSATSRSGSRIPLPSAISPSRHRTHVRYPIWALPEELPFDVCEMDSPSETLISYDPEGPDKRSVLPVSSYLRLVEEILEKETDWEILSYLLCHLPAQLSNKHLFCGPKSRDAIAGILKTICTGILNGGLASTVEAWPSGLKTRDAQGLAYHTLSVLVSYRRCFDMQLRHLLVEVFQAGLNGHPSTIKCCLHALTLSAFELQPSMTKCLSRILEKLSQIMSNPEMAVHILGFLSVVGSLNALHANFTEADFKMVFGVALQYLQHHNQNKTSPTISWALSQHVRILSFYIVYVWFLAIKIPDRPRHVKFITRQLLLANEGNQEVDELTEVCFDWLARYTYASADPRPSNSLLNDIVMNPNSTLAKNNERSEKTWLIGNSVLTVRSLERAGWVEVLSRRPSGFTKILCRVENVPLTNAGEVNPDLVSVTASLLMGRDISRPIGPPCGEDAGVVPQSDISAILPMEDGEAVNGGDTAEDSPPPPDSVTGYVWSGSAPSQRRKDVVVDPAFLVLQLSAYPDQRSAPDVRRLVAAPSLQKFLQGLDRIPVIDTHKVGILYVAPGQTDEVDILRNTHGSPAYTRFLEGLGRLINLRGQVDVYAGGLNPDEDGEYAYAWWDDIGQILYHTATMMPTTPHDPLATEKKRHIGNDYVRIVWNDSGRPYGFATLTTQFQFVNIVIEPHSVGAIAAFSNNVHEIEYFKVTMQLAPRMAEFAPIGQFKLISAENLPYLVRQVSLLADWFASVFEKTQNDTVHVEMKTNWHARLDAIRRLRNQLPEEELDVDGAARIGVMGQERYRDFTHTF
ncbi:hypothetical protein CCMSSC00406_0008591 [Pleurotus cornucopiae]|uniref:Uncharacterized protein n=1 Tax=Pleurotus cornucopiae TaxID=5321 RepID=A0ACB7IJT8_PLECO|nr:hypothetical protein CCMSSC00406_0008591 [Pleurotus cornucopiae]